jgi:hypothetical protein
MRRRLCLALALCALPDAARAGPPPFLSLSDAGLLEPGRWSVGLVAPLRIGLDSLIELDTHVVSWFLLAPNVQLRFRHLDSERLRLSSHLGLSAPTGAMWLLRGYLFPTWESSDRKIGWFVVPELGVAASSGRRLVVTASASLAVGVLVGRNDAAPPETYAPLELIFAPALSGHRATLQLGGDYALLRWLRLRLETTLHHIGEGAPPRSPWIVALSAGVDLAIRRWRLCLGATYYNYDQHAQELRRHGDTWRREEVRSNDVFPSVDVVYVR